MTTATGVRTWRTPAMPDVTITPATAEQKPVLERLMQLYCYDFSEILTMEVGAGGAFEQAPHCDYWTGGRYHPFLIHVGAHLAGFAIVDSRSRLSGEPLWDMSEFFVLRRHRRGGVGARAATLVFSLFPGKWEVRQAPRNVAAQAFWREAIGRYTQGHFGDVTLDDERFRGVVQSFVSA